MSDMAPQNKEMSTLPESDLSDITPVILAGGKGTRLWPLTAQGRSKSFLNLFSTKTLLQKTALRVQRCAAPMVVCNEYDAQKTQHDLNTIGQDPVKVFAEIDGRSTAASITLAALSMNPDALILVMPGDHVMSKPDQFLQQLKGAKIAALENKVVLFGTKPTSHAVRYGYVLAEGFGKAPIKKVQHFVEKPEKPRAVQLRAAGNCFWNTGIFLCRAGVFLDKLSRHAPAILEACARALDKAQHNGTIITPERDTFFRCPAIPVDVAVMEKARNLYVIDIKSKWADIGTWPSLLHAIVLRS